MKTLKEIETEAIVPNVDVYGRAICWCPDCEKEHFKKGEVIHPSGFIYTQELRESAIEDIKELMKQKKKAKNLYHNAEIDGKIDYIITKFNLSEEDLKMRKTKVKENYCEELCRLWRAERKKLIKKGADSKNIINPIDWLPCEMILAEREEK